MQVISIYYYGSVAIVVHSGPIRASVKVLFFSCCNCEITNVNEFQEDTE